MSYTFENFSEFLSEFFFFEILMNEIMQIIHMRNVKQDIILYIDKK